MAIILLHSFAASISDLYPITNKILFLGMGIILSSADNMIPSEPSEPAIIFCVSLIDLIKSILYPEEFFVTLGNLSYCIFFTIFKIFKPIFLS